MSFTPKTRLEKILCGVATIAKTRIEKAVQTAIQNAGSGGGGAAGSMIVTVTNENEDYVSDVSPSVIYAAVQNGIVPVAVCNEYTYVLVETDISNGEYYYADFVSITYKKSTITAKVLSINHDSSVDCDTYDFALDDDIPVTSPLDIHATIGSGNGGVQTVTLDVSAKELFDAAASGRMAHVYVPIQNDTHEAVIPIEAFKATSGYAVKMRIDSQQVDTLFYGSCLVADENSPMVLEAVSGQ